MKSSGPVFTRQNPFQPASRVGKAHYYPSRNQSLSKKEKKTNLSPERSKQRSSRQLRTLSPGSKRLSEKSHQRLTATDEEPVFAESWPSTECGYSPASTSTSSDMEVPKLSARVGKSTVSTEQGVQQDSVLAKYIERFRNGRPQSREERLQFDSAAGENQPPFWWMSPSSLPPTSTPTKTTDKDVIQPLEDDRGRAIFSAAGQRQRDRSLSPCRGSLSILSDTSQGEFDDTEILQLQERASRLLLRDSDDHEYTLSDGYIHVSSEGLGCSDFSSPVSVDEPLRRPLIPSMIKSTTAKASSDSVHAPSSQKSSVIPSLVPPARPEEDILFQWRLRRKIEQAREWPQSLQHSSLHGPAFSWQASSLSHPSASGHPYKQSSQPPEFSHKATHPHMAAPRPETNEAQASCPPASGPHPLPASVVSSVSQPQAIAHVPAHMHFLCDVLPCPIQSSHASRQPNISQSIDESHTRVVRKKTQAPRDSVGTFTDEPVCEDVPSAPPASFGAVEREGPSHRKTSERKAQKRESERKTASSSRKQNRSRYTVDREHGDVPGSTNKSSSHHKIPKKLMPGPEQQQPNRSQVFSERSTDDYAPPTSPIHSALGQVVSEVLFPTADSSPAQRSHVSSVAPSRVASAAPQSSVPPCDAQNSVEVISQLLQEAEDSDGEEFQDDPLLQVLRKQRTWVKEQISEVDSTLNDIQDEQQVT